MKSLKSLPLKKASKQERERKILLGLVAYYLKNGKPVGSHTLQEAGFDELSSATIRNYFATLEEEGYLEQQHTSAGRIPTTKAFKFYAEHCLDELAHGKEVKGVRHIPRFDESEMDAMKEVVLYLQRMTESVSELAHSACFLSAPRFDQDFVVDMKLIAFDQGRYLSALLTSFGQIHTEILHSPVKLSAHTIKRLESYFRARLTAGVLAPDELDKDELELAHRFYQEAMARYLVTYSNFSEEDIYRAGFSKLLRYPEFQDAAALASSLSLFENQTASRALVRECMKAGKIKYWIGEDLLPYLRGPLNCSVIAAPYRIGQKVVGAIGIIGPLRVFYDELFVQLNEVANSISLSLSRSLMKYKIAFRTPEVQVLKFEGKPTLLLEQKDKTTNK
jgi:heat-inducible transcriptional repressor